MQIENSQNSFAKRLLRKDERVWGDRLARRVQDEVLNDQYCKTFFAAIDGLKLRIFYYFISGETELIEHASFIDIYKSVYSLADFMTFSVF